MSRKLRRAWTGLLSGLRVGRRGPVCVEVAAGELVGHLGSVINQGNVS
jgi:hypothetical protein